MQDSTMWTDTKMMKKTNIFLELGIFSHVATRYNVDR
jgi:hypothetical protein